MIALRLFRCYISRRNCLFVCLFVLLFALFIFLYSCHHQRTLTWWNWSAWWKNCMWLTVIMETYCSFYLYVRYYCATVAHKISSGKLLFIWTVVYYYFWKKEKKESWIFFFFFVQWFLIPSLYTLVGLWQL